MPEVILEVSLDRGDLPLPTLSPGDSVASASLTLVTPGTIKLPLRLNRQPDAGEVQWVSGEWAQLRSVVGISVTPPSAKIAALRISAGGVWFTPVPPGGIEPGTFQPACRFSLQSKNPFRFPPLTATGVLLEIVAEQKVTDKPSNWNADTAPFTAMEVEALNELVDLSVGLDEDPPFFSFKGRKNDTVVLDLMPQLQAKPAAKKLRVRAAGPVQIRANLDLRTLSAAPPPSAPPRATLQPPESGQGEAVASWTVEAPKALAAVRATVVRAPVAERVVLSPPVAPDIRLAQLLDATHGAAQPIDPVEGKLTLAELWLGARLGAAAGTLALHADANGRPGEALVSAPWTLNPGEARWVSLAVDRAIAGPFWLVARASAGEAWCGLWEAGAPAALGQAGLGPWQLAAGMAWHRVRVEAPPPETVKVVVARDNARVELRVKDSFSLDAAAITQLNTRSGPVVVEVRSEVAGEMELRDLRVALTP